MARRMDSTMLMEDILNECWAGLSVEGVCMYVFDG